MVEEKTHEHGKSGSCGNLGLHDPGFCGLYVFVVHVAEANVVHVNHKKHMVDPICGSCEPQKTHKPQNCGSCVFGGSHEPQFHMVDPICGSCVFYGSHEPQKCGSYDDVHTT